MIFQQQNAKINTCNHIVLMLEIFYILHSKTQCHEIKSIYHILSAFITYDFAWKKVVTGGSHYLLQYNAQNIVDLLKKRGD